MAHENTYVVPYRRKRQGKTNFHKRIRLLLSGKPRLVIRKSDHNISAQIITYQPAGDTVLASAHSRELSKLGWKGGLKSVPAAYLVGLLIGHKAKKNKIAEAVADIGIYTTSSGSKMYAVIKGAIDGGLNVPCNTESTPKEDRLHGKHIITYLKTAPAKEFAKQRRELTQETYERMFENIRKKILS